MKFAFAVFLLIALTVVSSQLTQNWLLDWQTGSVTCAPANLNIFSNSSGLFVAYGYSYGTLNTYECYGTLDIQTNFTSNLTLNTSTGAYVDKMNQSLTYYSNNNTIIFYLPPTVPDTPILFTPNGAYISQEEVAGLLAGVWANVTYNQECQTAPPTNISISILQSNGGIESPTAKYYMTSYPYSATATLTLYVPQINQIIWQMTYSGTSNISYTVNSGTNQSSLHFQVYNSPSYGACIGTYTRSNNLTSGTWISDWQNGDYQSTYVPSSVQVFNIYNMYMRITFNFASGSASTGILYPSANGYTDSIYGDTYYPSSNTFILNVNGKSYLFSTTGSVFNLQPFLGEWSDPQVQDYSDVSDYCCYPRSIRIYNLTDEYDLSSLFIFDGYVANSTGCRTLRNYITNNVYLHMGLTIPSPNGTALTYQNTQYGYSLSFNSSDSAQLIVSYNYENYDTCNFTMMGRAPPRPLSVQLIAKGISTFIFALIVIFI